LDDDGLSRPWEGCVFLNPPYSADLVGKFTAKLVTHHQAGDVTAAVLLVNNATDARWFQAAAKACAALCFPAGRVRFLDEQGNPGAPLQGQAILYFGREVEGFVREFGQFGFCR
jgi:DNA N-6-adenine-methyltransferase (Dam)